MKRLLLLGILLLGILPGQVHASGHIPIGLQKIIDYNNQSTADFAVKISFFIAFLAGVLSILSPCILPLLPAYFSYTFRERKNITLMTLVFFAGFTLSFVSMGIVAGLLGAQVLLAVQSGWLVTIAGLVIVGFGILSLLGKGFSSLVRTREFKNDIPGTFLFGVFFALGWTACLGPILAGILGIGAVLHNPLQSGVLLFFYSLGILAPLFILSVFYDSLNVASLPLFRRKITLMGKPFPLMNLLSGGLLILLGTFIVVFQGTGAVNTWDIFGTRQYFYSFQNMLLAWDAAWWVSGLTLILFTLWVGWFLWRKTFLRK